MSELKSDVLMLLSPPHVQVVLIAEETPESLAFLAKLRAANPQHVIVLQQPMSMAVNALKDFVIPEVVVEPAPVRTKQHHNDRNQWRYRSKRHQK